MTEDGWMVKQGILSSLFEKNQFRYLMKLKNSKKSPASSDCNDECKQIFVNADAE